MAFLDIFVGVPQSKYTATAILAAIIVVSLAILFGKEHIPLGQKFAFVLIVFLVSLPSIVLTLFQLTCLVTGSSKNRWCGWYAWLVSILLIIYSVLIIVIAVVAFSSGKSVNKSLNLGSLEGFEEEKVKSDIANANHFANEYFENSTNGATAPTIVAKQPESHEQPPMPPMPMKKEPFADEEDYENEEQFMNREAFAEDYENIEEPFVTAGGASIPAPAGTAAKFSNVMPLY